MRQFQTKNSLYLPVIVTNRLFFEVFFSCFLTCGEMSAFKIHLKLTAESCTSALSNITYPEIWR
jgi:hypothetical protein